MREDKAFSKCTECLASYTLVPPPTVGGESVKARQLRFSMLVWRDLLILSLLTHVPIVFFALVTFWADAETGYHLAQFLHAAAHGHPPNPVIATLLYYGCGCACVLELAGLAYMGAQCFCGTGMCSCNEDLNLRAPADIYQWLMYSGDSGMGSSNPSLTYPPLPATRDQSADQSQTQGRGPGRPSPVYAVTCSSCCVMVCAPCCCFCCTGPGDAYYYDDPEQQDHAQHHDYENIADDTGTPSASTADADNFSAGGVHDHRRRHGSASGGRRGIGTMGSSPWLICCSPQRWGCRRCVEELCCTRYGCSGLDCMYIPIYGSNDLCCCDCCCSSSAAHGSLFDCAAGSGCCDMGALDCAGASLGEECLLAAVVVAIVVLIVGLFVLFLLGGALLETVLLKHVHVLQKRTLVEHYQVLDLCADDLANRAGSGDGSGIELGSLTMSPMATISSSSPTPSAPQLTSAQYQELHRYGLLSSEDEDLSV